MSDDLGPVEDAPPHFDDDQWRFILRKDAFMEQVVRHTATLEVLHSYYQEITAALHRQPSSELLTLQRSTIARIRAATAGAAEVLARAEQKERHPDVRALQRMLGERPRRDPEDPAAAA